MIIGIKDIFEEITPLGGMVFYFLFSLWFLFDKDYSLFFILFLGVIIIYLFTIIIRAVYFKQRPRKQKYKNFIEKIDASAFPSVHAARISFLLMFLFFYIFKDLILMMLAFILTLLIIYSRIYLKKHDLIDVLGGVILGIFSFIISSRIF